jgi:acyl-ACP thioesterase
MREYEMVDEAGAAIGRGRSAWLIVDAASFRPRRPEAIAATMPSRAELETLPGGAQAIKPSEELELRAERTVSYSDIDYNGHMNNARYVQWIQDALDPGELASAASMRLDINYVAEMRPGSSAGIFSGPSAPEPGWTKRLAVEGRTGDGQSSFRAGLSLLHRQ